LVPWTADAAWAAGNWEEVRGALSQVFNNRELAPQWRSIAHLRYARSFQAAGDWAEAGAIYATIAAKDPVHFTGGGSLLVTTEPIALPAADATPGAE